MAFLQTMIESKLTEEMWVGQMVVLGGEGESVGRVGVRIWKSSMLPNFGWLYP